MNALVQSPLVETPVEPGIASAPGTQFRPMRVPLPLKAALRGLSACAPEAAARLAARLFLTPPRGRKVSGWEREIAAGSRTCTMQVGRMRIKQLIYGDAERPRGTVVLVHGWGGRGTSMARFARPLATRGYRVVMFDAPAHGDSSNRSTDGIEVATTIAHLCRELGAVDAIVAHSYGAACTLLAHGEFGLDVGKLVLIGCYASAIEMSELYGRHLALKSAIVARMRERIEERLNWRWTWEQVAPLELIRSVRASTLLIHDEDDADIAPSNADRLAAANPRVRLLKTCGHGHRRVLHAEPAIAAATEFITEAV